MGNAGRGPAGQGGPPGQLGDGKWASGLRKAQLITSDSGEWGQGLRPLKSLTKSSAGQLVPGPCHLRAGRLLGLGRARGPAAAYQLDGADLLAAAGCYQKGGAAVRG